MYIGDSIPFFKQNPEYSDNEIYKRTFENLAESSRIPMVEFKTIPFRVECEIKTLCGRRSNIRRRPQTADSGVPKQLARYSTIKIREDENCVH